MKKTKRIARHNKVRKNIFGTPERPRLSVFKSVQHIYAQIIDDTTGKTLASSNDLKIESKGTKKEKAMLVGETLAKMATKGKITKVVFDRGGFKYHGRVSSLAEGARKGGLDF